MLTHGTSSLAPTDGTTKPMKADKLLAARRREFVSRPRPWPTIGSSVERSQYGHDAPCGCREQSRRVIFSYIQEHEYDPGSNVGAKETVMEITPAVLIYPCRVAHGERRARDRAPRRAPLARNIVAPLWMKLTGHGSPCRAILHIISRVRVRVGPDASGRAGTDRLNQTRTHIHVIPPYLNIYNWDIMLKPEPFHHSSCQNWFILLMRDPCLLPSWNLASAPTLTPEHRWLSQHLP